MMDTLRYQTLPIAVLVFQLLVPVNGFSCLSSWSVGSRVHHRMEWALPSTSSSTTPNEFSRPLHTNRILKTSSGKQRRTYREYETTLEATSEECLALAKRFDLCQLSSLQAELSLSLPPHFNTQTTSNSYLTVQVEGSILANITQTCVRTNEDFDMTVEFPITAIVKPVSFFNNRNNDNDYSTTTRMERKKTKNTSPSRKVAMDMADLQQMIQEAESNRNSPRRQSSTKKKETTRIRDTNDDYEDEDAYDYFGTEEILEDESIYSSSNGILDVGELVAQTFYLNLDRYPKKPGTGPLEYTISG